jgi:hypothetical protein
MTNPEPNARLNVPNRLVSPPVGDFSLATSGDVSIPVPEGSAIIAKSEYGAGTSGSVRAPFQMGNLNTPPGELTRGADAEVTPVNDLTFTASAGSQVVDGLSVAPTPLSALDSAPGASLDLGKVKFTY